MSMKRKKSKAKAGKGKRVKPVVMWAEISEDVPPSIWAVNAWREHLRQDLRHIRVRITPTHPKPRRKP